MMEQDRIDAIGRQIATQARVNVDPAISTATLARADFDAMVEAMRKARAVLKTYEAWEADLILHGDWSNEFVRMNAGQHEEMLRLQNVRLDALINVDAALTKVATL